MIILASNSWLRKTIMDSSRLEFRVEAAEIDERTLELQLQDETDEMVVVTLAKAKAAAVHLKYPADLVIAADTFAILQNGQRLHKPATVDEAVELCLAQAGQTVRVVTGLVMTYKSKSLVDYSSTDIAYINFSRETITKLLRGDDATVRNSGLGFFSDAPGFTLVRNFSGSYTGAMGLPMETVRANLQALDYTG